MLQKFLAHPDSGVLHLKFVGRAAFRRISLLQDPDAHDSAGFREFHSIAQKIQKNLIQPQLVAQDMLIDYVRGIYVKFQLLGCDIRLDDRFQVVHDFRKGGLLFLDLDLSALNPAHVQNIIDQAQQMVAGCGDLGQIILDLLGIVDMRCGKGRKSDDSVHRRPDVVGHIIEKCSLCPVGMLGCSKRVLEVNGLLLQPCFHFFLIINIQEKSHKRNR